MIDLLADLSSAEIRSVQRLPLYPGGEQLTLIGAQSSSDRILQVAKSVQAGIGQRDDLPKCGRLVIGSYKEAGEYLSDDRKTEICYWVNLEDGDF